MTIRAKRKKIAVAGTGYVGLSLAVLLSQNNSVYAVDIVPQKIDLINQRKSPIQDDYIEKYLQKKELDLTATMDARAAYAGADFIVIAVPTNYDCEKNCFDTSVIETVLRQVRKVNSSAVVVIKSTIPVGYTAKLRKETGDQKILFSPEFLRESYALYDNLYPSRIIMGTDLQNEALTRSAREFAKLLSESALKENVDVHIIGSTEAESVKLFANAHFVQYYHSCFFSASFDIISLAGRFAWPGYSLSGADVCPVSVPARL